MNPYAKRVMKWGVSACLVRFCRDIMGMSESERWWLMKNRPELFKKGSHDMTDTAIGPNEVCEPLRSAPHASGVLPERADA
ncbi:hypothetical protein ABH935_004167 [Catenulispora sp. GAS73]|uniref:hypothetical protein n=1 Tax=Catenulispora sp. GAS73 TaxID=3156269 RepID=UPI003512E6FD